MPLENSERPSSGDGAATPEMGTPEQRRALDELFSLTYEELRRLASSVRRGDPSATLTPTVLVNEAWMKLSKSPGAWLRFPPCTLNASPPAPCASY